jgi:hypothetical protein
MQKGYWFARKAVGVTRKLLQSCCVAWIGMRTGLYQTSALETFGGK